MLSFFSVAFSLFVVLNSLGNIPLFVGILARYKPKEQRRIIIRELFIALFILLIFNFFGHRILGLLHISQPIIGIAGGVLLFIIALGMIFPKIHPKDRPLQEPFIVPLATPIVAGPGAIAMVMVYADQIQSHWFMAGVVMTAWLFTLAILLLSSTIKYILGERGLTACERLGGMLLSLIAVQMLSSGILTLVYDYIAARS